MADVIVIGARNARRRIRLAARGIRITGARVRMHGGSAVRTLGAWVGRFDLDRLSMGSFVVILAVFAGARLIGADPWTLPAFDSYSYWITRDGLDYGTAEQGRTGAFLYSPAFAQLIAPLTSLSWPVFAGLWTLAAAAPLVWLAGRYAVFLCLLPPVAMSIALGQLDFAFAVVAMVGLRWPAVWALPILTKVTPGIGLVWFLARGEWRSFCLAIGATAAIAAVSIAIDPAGWIGWIALLVRMDFPVVAGGLLFVPVDLWIRLPIAIGLVAWGARTDRRWTIPVGMFLALPTIFVNSVTILVALLPLMAAGSRTPAGAWMRTAARRGGP